MCGTVYRPSRQFVDGGKVDERGRTGVSACARHGTNNPLVPYVKLLWGGREVVRGWGVEPRQAQPIEEFEIRVTELVRHDSSIIGRPIDWAERLVLGQPIGPQRSWLLHLLNCHPEDSGMGRVLSLHRQALPGMEERPYALFQREDIRRSQPPSC